MAQPAVVEFRLIGAGPGFRWPPALAEGKAPRPSDHTLGPWTGPRVEFFRPRTDTYMSTHLPKSRWTSKARPVGVPCVWARLMINARWAAANARWR